MKFGLEEKKSVFENLEKITVNRPQCGRLCAGQLSRTACGIEEQSILGGQSICSSFYRKSPFFLDRYQGFRSMT
jgi:hypothetical protein